MHENLSQREELGGAIAVILEGRTVVDLWCGWSDEKRTRQWRQETLVNAFSVGKALAALSVLTLASRGLLTLDEPVARHWPEFAAGGKEAITLAQVLSHQAAIPAIARELPSGAVYDWDLVTGAIAEQEPWWTPGDGHGYHVHTFGFILGELVRRSSGLTLGAFARREITEPLELELGFGLARAKRTRRAEYVFDAMIGSRAQQGLWGLASGEKRAGGQERAGGQAPADERPELRLRELAYMNPPGVSGLGTVNTPAWQDAELPSANLHADARSLARLYAALVDVRQPLLAGEMLARATAKVAAGEDRVLGRPSRFGLGFQLTQPQRPFGPNEGSFGHFGAGGSVAFADPQARLAFGYVTNRGGPGWQDPRNRALIGAVYDSIEG